MGPGGREASPVAVLAQRWSRPGASVPGTSPPLTMAQRGNREDVRRCRVRDVRVLLARGSCGRSAAGLCPSSVC